MAHGGNIDVSFFVENGVNDSIIADTNAPQVFLTSQFARTMWPCVSCKGLDLGEDAGYNR